MGPIVAIIATLGFCQADAVLHNQIPITVHADVGPISKAVQEIAKQSKLTLTTDADETVYIDAKSQPTGEILTHLATAIGGKWMKTPTGFNLSRDKSTSAIDPEVVRRTADLEALRDRFLNLAAIPMTPEKITPIVKNRVDLMAQREKKQDSVDSDKIYGTNYLDPAFRCLGRCLKNVNMAQLATMAPQSRITFKPDEILPALDACKTLLKEQKIWGPILKKNYKPEQGEFFSDREIEFTRGYPHGETRINPWNRTLPFENDPASVSLSVFCYQADVYEFDLVLFDANKKELETLHYDDLNTWPKHDESTAKAPKHSFPAVKPSPETAALWRRFGNGLDRPELGPTTLYEKFLLDPVNNDPLWFGNHELLEALSTAQPKAIVACLPDKAHFHFEKELSLNDYLDDPADKGLKLVEETNWMTLSPKNSADHRAHRTSRQDIAAYTNEVKTHGRYDILLYARIKAVDSAFETYYVHTIDPGYYVASATFDMPFQSAFTQLLVSLNEDQMKRMKDGQTIAYRDLRPEQKALCSQIVYGARVNTTTEGQTNPDQLGGDINSGEGLALEAKTEEYLCLHNQQTNATKDDTFHIIDVNYHGLRFSSGPGPQFPKGGMKDVTYDVRHMQSLTLRCYLKGKNAVVGKFRQPMPKATTKPVSLDQIPAEIRNKVASEIESLMKMAGYSKGGK